MLSSHSSDSMSRWFVGSSSSSRSGWDASERASDARVTLLDVGGRVVRELADGWRDAGEHALTWDGTTDRGEPAPAGMYFVSARIGDWSVTRHVVLVR